MRSFILSSITLTATFTFSFQAHAEKPRAAFCIAGAVTAPIALQGGKPPLPLTGAATVGTLIRLDPADRLKLLLEGGVTTPLTAAYLGPVVQVGLNVRVHRDFGLSGVTIFRYAPAYDAPTSAIILSQALAPNVKLPWGPVILLPMGLARNLTTHTSSVFIGLKVAVPIVSF